MSEQVYLAVDLGAESGRVIAGRFDGKSVKLDEVHRFPNGAVSVGGTLRWNLVGLWSNILDGLAKAGAQYGESVVSVGVDTWGVDYVLMSAKNEMLGLPYCYRDSRTSGLMAHAFTQVPKSKIFADTGLQFMEINTLYQLVAMQQQDPELLELAEYFLMIPDYFHWLLSGSRVVEFTNATTSQCYHATDKSWAYEMLKGLQIPTDMFPPVVEPGTKLGSLREEIARRTGLGRIDVVAPATHDTGSAVAAVPTKNTGSPNWAYISSGTWSLMGVEVQNAILTPQAMALNVTNEGGIDGTYRLLKNIMGLWLVQQSRVSFERSGHAVDYSQLTQAAADAEPFRSLVNPDDARFLSPDDMVASIRDFCESTGQPIPESEGQVIRCALESLALKYRVVLESLEQLTGVPIEVIHIVGGGTQNELLNQLTANACGRAVITGPVEATGFGNVLIQARAHGEIASLSELRSVVRNSCEIKRYEPQDAELWAQALAKFSALA